MENEPLSFNPEYIFQMLDETSHGLADESSIRLSSCGFAAIGSETLTNSVEFWAWLNRNYGRSAHFASADNMLEFLQKSESSRAWMEKIIQGKGYEFDWMVEQRKAFQNIFKTFDAGDVANRPGSDISVYNLLTRTTEEQQLKAYRSTAKVHLSNTPKSMTVVTNAEKVEQVKAQGYADVISFKDRDRLIADTDKRISEIESGTASPIYTASNVGAVLSKAGILGFAVGIGSEALLSYERYKNGKISKKEYIREILMSGGDSGVTAALSAGVMIPVTATLTVAGVTSLVTIPISFTVSTTVNKIIAPAFARGEYRAVLNEAFYYSNITDLCASITGSIMRSTEQYEQFVVSMYYQSQAFYRLRGEEMPTDYQQDFEYLAKLPRDQISLTVTGMIALAQNSSQMYDSLKNQNFFKRMVLTVLGSNKATKEEIQKNSSRLSVYMAQAISFLYERQAVDERIVQMLGQQILDLGIENQAIRNKIQVLSERVDLHQLILEIDHEIFNSENPLVAIYHIASLISPEQACFYRELNVVKAAMEKQRILSSSPLMEEDIIRSVQSLPADQLVLLYAALRKSHNSGLTNDLLSLTDELLFRGQGKGTIGKGPQSSLQKGSVSSQTSTTYSEIFDQLLVQKKSDTDHLAGSSFSMLQELQNAEEMFFAGKLVEAFPLFIRAAEEKVARAYYYLSMYYAEGYGEIIEDNEQALAYAKTGMDLGDPLCTYSYGIIKFYITKESPETWMKQKLKLINPLVRNNDPCALFEQGNYYTVQNLLNGKRSAKEVINKAKVYLARSADQGFWPAAYYYNILSPSFDRSLNHFPEYSSILVDVESYEIQFTYGRYYLFADFESHKYYEQAAKCFLRALALREDFKQPAGYVAFLLGTGLIKDSLRTGISKGNIPMYYKAGLSCDNPVALFEFMLLYSSGVGEKAYGANPTKAYECAKKCYSLTKSPSYKKMHTFVTAFLGESCLEGCGIEKDEKSAVVYLTEAIDAGDSYSAKLLADYYSKGLKSIFHRSVINDLREKSKNIKEREITEETFFSILEEAMDASVEQIGAS